MSVADTKSSNGSSYKSVSDYMMRYDQSIRLYCRWEFRGRFSHLIGVDEAALDFLLQLSHALLTMAVQQRVRHHYASHFYFNTRINNMNSRGFHQHHSRNISSYFSPCRTVQLLTWWTRGPSCSSWVCLGDAWPTPWRACSSGSRSDRGLYHQPAQIQYGDRGTRRSINKSAQSLQDTWTFTKQHFEQYHQLTAS